MTLFICKDRKSILDAEGHVLVTGGPGSGKTTIALLKAQIRIKADLPFGQSVLFLSFSKAAVSRIIETSRTDLPKALQSRLAIQTFHSFFWGILRGHSYLVGALKRLQLLLPHDERALRSGAEGEDPAWNLESERLFNESGLITFDLFAPKALAILTGSRCLRNVIASCYPLIIVDEAQDTSEDQWQCVKTLAEKSQLICLADLEQQIFDFRPGVTSERLTVIMEDLKPLRVDLQSQNHRSPNSEIVRFGNDILLNTPRGSAYKGVSRKQFKPDRLVRDNAIRSSVGMIAKKVAATTGKPPESVAILATWNRGAAIISRALTGNGAEDLIRHTVTIDDALVLLSSRLVAFLLEPRRSRPDENADIVEGLEIISGAYRSKGGKTSLDLAQRLAVVALNFQEGRTQRKDKTAETLRTLMRELSQETFSGDPKEDWIHARKKLARAASRTLVDIAAAAEQLTLLQKGQRIARALSDLWQAHGCYLGARTALDGALSEEQMLSGIVGLHGIHVMTIHRSKAKEFDGVVILDDSNGSPLLFTKEPPPYARSRKLLRVGITRAKHHVVMLTDLYKPSILLNGHKL